MTNWIKENKTPITVVVSAVATITVVLGVMLTSINTIHYRLDDTNQRFSDLRTEMNQRFDAQDKYINQRFDAQDKYINQRFDAQDKRIDDLENDLKTEINLRFNAQDQRLERLENDVSELHTLIVSIRDRVSRNEGQINLLTQQLNTAETNPRPEPGTTLPPTD